MTRHLRLLRDADPLEAQIARAIEDVERLRSKVADGAQLGDALAVAEYRLAGLRRRKVPDSPEPPEAA